MTDAAAVLHALVVVVAARAGARRRRAGGGEEVAVAAVFHAADFFPLVAGVAVEGRHGVGDDLLRGKRRRRVRGLTL